MDTPYRLITSRQPDDERCALVDAGLTAFDEAVPAFSGGSWKSWEPLHVFLQNDGGVVGGVTGRVHRTWGWLHVEDLWVNETIRGQGCGRALMQRIEEEAYALGCRHADLRTFDFQAPGFYQKLGYRIVGRLDDFPEGHCFYWLRKDFD